MARLLNLFRWRRDRLERDLDRELRYHMDRRVEDMIKNGLERARGPTAGEPRARRRRPGAGGRAGHVDLAMARCAHARRALCDTRPDQELGFHARRRRRARPGHRCQHRHLLGGQHGAASAARLPRRRAPRLDRDVLDQHRTCQPGRVRPDFLDWQAQNDVFEKMAVSFGDDDEAIVVGDRADVCQRRVRLGRVLCGVRPDRVCGTAADGATISRRNTRSRRSPSWRITGQRLTSAAPRPRSEKRSRSTATRWRSSEWRRRDFAIPAPRISGRPTARPTTPTNRSDHTYQAVGKLKGDVDLTRAQAQMRAIGDALARQYPENRFKTATVMPLQQRLTGNLQATLWVLMSAVGVVWLIGCANIANLLLARAAGRTREIALRAALGAGRGRVVRQLLTESCVLAGVAGLAGLLLASTLVQGLAALSPATLPGIDEVRMDMPVLLFALGLSLVSTVLFGLVPALHGSRLDLSGALKQGGSKASGARAGTRLRSALVVAEVALSVILLATAGLLLRSFQALQHVDLGFTTDRVLVAFTEYAVTDDPADLRTRSTVLCRCARPSACRARGEGCVGRGLPWDGTRAQVTSRLLHSGPTGGSTGRAAASRVPRDHGRLLQDAGDSGSCRARFRQDRHAGSAAGRHHQRDPGTRRLSGGVAHWTAYSDGDESQGALDGDRRGCWRHPLAGPESTRAAR